MMRMHALRTLSAYPREAFGVFIIAVAAFFALLGLVIAPSPPLSGTAQANTPTLRSQMAALGAPPAPEPLRFKDVTPDDARSINAMVPFSALPNPAARPLVARFGDPMNEARALDCLTAAVYYEAAIEPPDGQRAVAQVVLNRLRHPAYPKTVCGVVFQGSERSTGCQFTFTCDGALARTPLPNLWKRAREIAWAALSGQVFAPVGWATHYHTDWVVPYWASSLAKAEKIGTHIFYRWTGGWGRSPAFTGRYAGLEPVTTGLASLSVAHETPGEELALAAGAALDQLAAGDVVTLPVAGQAPMPLPRMAGVTPPPTSVTSVASALPGGTPATGTAVPPASPATRVPWELRWALTGAGGGAAEPALGTPPATVNAKSQPKAEACLGATKVSKVAVGGDKSAPSITVRERCGG